MVLTMSKHTPGPWQLIGTSIVGDQTSETYTLVCRLNESNRLFNAAVIAAAPDLLDVAKASLAILERTPFCDHLAILDSLKEVIAKAEGK